MTTKKYHGPQHRQTRSHHRRRPPERWNDESGAVAVVFAVLFSIIVGMVVAGVVLGQKAVQERMMQNAADAAALTAAFHIEQRGRPANNNQFHGTASTASVAGNTSLTPGGIYKVFDCWAPGTPQNRVVVQVDLQGTWDSQQTWFDKLFNVAATSYAQVNQQKHGERWPALVVVLDASKSMGEDILGVTGQSAYGVLRRAFLQYAGLQAAIPLGGGPPTLNTLPVRNGLVIFRNVQLPTWRRAPLNNNNRNAAGVNSVFASVPPPCPDHDPSCGLVKTDPGTNTSQALRRAGQMLLGQPADVGRNVLLITDGEPTLSGTCSDVTAPCAAADHFSAARNAATFVRNTAQAALFVVEIRRKAHDPRNTALLRNMAGQPSTGGGDGNMVFAVQSQLGIQTFMLGLSRSICAFGPLVPGPGAPANAWRFRAANPVLANSAAMIADPRRQRVFAYIVEADGRTERPMRMVPNRDTVNTPGDFAFQYFVDGATNEAFVVLNLPACNYLGADGRRTIVVRSDDAQLTGRPPGPPTCRPNP